MTTEAERRRRKYIDRGDSYELRGGPLHHGWLFFCGAIVALAGGAVTYLLNS